MLPAGSKEWAIAYILWIEPSNKPYNCHFSHKFVYWTIAQSQRQISPKKMGKMKQSRRRKLPLGLQKSAVVRLSISLTLYVLARPIWIALRAL